MSWELIADISISVGWLYTEEGQVFVIDTRRAPRMEAAPEPIEQDRPETAATPTLSPALPPNETAVVPKDEPVPESNLWVGGLWTEDLPLEGGVFDWGIDNRPNTVPDNMISAQQLQAPPDVPVVETAEREVEGGKAVQTAVPQTIALSEDNAEATYLAGTVNASKQDFTHKDDDFCKECRAFSFDHTAYCPVGRQLKLAKLIENYKRGGTVN